MCSRTRAIFERRCQNNELRSVKMELEKLQAEEAKLRQSLKVGKGQLQDLLNQIRLAKEERDKVRKFTR